MNFIKRACFQLSIKALVLFGSSFSLFALDQIPWQEYKHEILSVVPMLHGWCSQEKAERMMELVMKASPQVYVEIGVFGGSSFLPTTAALKYQKKGMGYAIDPWATQACLEGQDGINYEWWSKIDLEEILKGFKDAMSAQGLDKYYKVLRMTSKEALLEFKNGTIDILHIDGNHAEESALFDAKNWLPKVRKGGYILFDDANWAQTKKAVEFLLQYCDLDSTSKITDPYLLLIKR